MIPGPVIYSVWLSGSDLAWAVRCLLIGTKHFPHHSDNPCLFPGRFLLQWKEKMNSLQLFSDFCTFTVAHVYIDMHTHTQSHTQLHTQGHTVTHTRTHTDTYTQGHTQKFKTEGFWGVKSQGFYRGLLLVGQWTSRWSTVTHIWLAMNGENRMWDW